MSIIYIINTDVVSDNSTFAMTRIKLIQLMMGYLCCMCYIYMLCGYM